MIKDSAIKIQVNWYQNKGRVVFLSQFLWKEKIQIIGLSTVTKGKGLQLGTKGPQPFPWKLEGGACNTIIFQPKKILVWITQRVRIDCWEILIVKSIELNCIITSIIWISQSKANLLEIRPICNSSSHW